MDVFGRRNNAVSLYEYDGKHTKHTGSKKALDDTLVELSLARVTQLDENRGLWLASGDKKAELALPVACAMSHNAN